MKINWNDFKVGEKVQGKYKRSNGDEMDFIGYLSAKGGIFFKTIYLSPFSSLLNSSWLLRDSVLEIKKIK